MLKRVFLTGLLFLAFLGSVSVGLAREELGFELGDCYGRVVSSQDYKGVPVFLEFGACW